MSNYDVLDGKKYTRCYLKHKLYIGVFDTPDGCPHAIQISASDFNLNQDRQLLSVIDWGVRFTTLALRQYSVEKVIRELRNTALGEDTLAAVVASVLIEHCEGRPNDL